MRGARSRLVAVVVAATSLITACGGDTQMADSVMAPRAAAEVVEVVDTTIAPTTAAPTTEARRTVVSTTTAPTTTTVPETTTIPATVVPETTLPPTTVPPTTAPAPVKAPAPAPVEAPIAPPADSRGQEPVIELGSIEIPRIGIAAPLFEGIRLTTLDRGPGHWPGTAMPGATGNVVVAGHRTSHSKPFRYLDQLEPGDEVIFTTADGRFVYNVVGTEIVTPDAIHIIDQTPDSTATLFACHPVGSTRQRIVVHLVLAAV